MEKMTLNLSANCSWDLGRGRGTALTWTFGLMQWVWGCHVVAAVVDIPPWLLSHPLSPSKPEQSNESWIVLDFNFCWSREPQRGTKSKSRRPQSHKPGIPHRQGRAASIGCLWKHGTGVISVFRALHRHLCARNIVDCYLQWEPIKAMRKIELGQ